MACVSLTIKERKEEILKDLMDCAALSRFGPTSAIATAGNHVIFFTYIRTERVRKKITVLQYLINFQAVKSFGWLVVLDLTAL